MYNLIKINPFDKKKSRIVHTVSHIYYADKWRILVHRLIEIHAAYRCSKYEWQMVKTIFWRVDFVFFYLVTFKRVSV